MQKTIGTRRHAKLIKLLIEKREQAGLTQTQLAERLSEYQSFVARMESGQRRIDVVEWIELSNILGFAPERLVQELINIDSE